ncbi:hypothetical protein [Lactiplantibacillus plantarum]|uniref:hypothetical protein n=1 Tax=Lactiplantibacillus plantarum TaxID=1590 RepID=UPI0040462DEB
MHLPVDEEGMRLPDADAAPGMAPPRFIFVTPSHQYPLGPVMSLARRRQLLAVARRHGSWIIEDDYDSEFRFSGLSMTHNIAVLPGDGIGPEIIVKACAQGLNAPCVVYGDAGALRRAASALGARLAITEIAHAGLASGDASRIEVIACGQ